MIENFYKKHSCQNIYSYKSRYKAICDEKIVIINNQFSIDFDKNIYIEYKNIKSKNLNEKQIEVETNNFHETLYFKENSHSEEFYKELEKKLR